jgi:hypothetical protein
VRLIDEAGVELSVDGCWVEVGSVGDDDEFGAAGPVGPLVKPVCLASLSDYLEQVSVVRIVGAVDEPGCPGPSRSRPTRTAGSPRWKRPAGDVGLPAWV